MNEREGAVDLQFDEACILSLKEANLSALFG
jgi:hypothetical protein